MKINNKGVSLVELIVTIAILGVVTVAVQSFILTSAKINSKVTSNVKLQYESQLVMANVQKQLANTGEAVFCDEDTLLMVTEADGGNNTVSIFFLDNNNTFYYGEDDSISNLNTASVNVYKLAEYVTDFDVTLISDAEDKVTQANITLKIERNGKEYIGTQSVALRNKPIKIGSCNVNIMYEKNNH